MLLTVLSKTADSDMLKDKYAESFVNELSRQITEEISRAMSVSGLDESTLELQLVFEPGTYMEHTSENVTYRRLMITDKLCQPRDFWVKWTRLDGAVAYTVSDEVTSETIKFEIGEDVPQKIREKEFRFLCFTNPDKYQSSMSKKTATEWRELIKRAVKRGDIEKVEIEDTLDFNNDEVNDRLARILGMSSAPVKIEETAPAGDFDKVMEMARAAIADYSTDENEKIEEDEEIALPESPVFELGEVLDGEKTEDPKEETDEDETADEFTLDEAPSFDFDLVDEDESEEGEEILPDADEADDEKNEEDEMVYNEEIAKLVEERMRAELEAKIRLEYEERARAKAEEEARQLRLENERLAEAARLAIEEKERYERERLEAEERQRNEQLEQKRLAEEARIKEELEQKRLAEEARIAEEERARRERERLEAEERRRKEEEEERQREEAERAKEAAERDRLAEAARQAVLEERRREAEEAERKAKEEAERKAKEEAAKKKAAEQKAQKPKAPETFTSHATITFRKSVDISVINKIQEIIEKTLVECGKDDVPMHLKAFQVDDNIVGLDIIRLPLKEKDLIVTLMKALGNGQIGISKITVE